MYYHLFFSHLHISFLNYIFAQNKNKDFNMEKINLRIIQYLKDAQSKIEEKIECIAQTNGLTNGDSSFPIYDGVGNIKEYLLSKPRIACLLKEPWDEIVDGKAQGGGWSMCDLFKQQNQNWPILTWQRVIYTVYGLRNNLKYMEMDYIRDDRSMGEVLRSIAWINLNKMPAKKRSDQTYIENFIKYWKDIVKEQLKIYSPDVILCGKVFGACREILFPQAKLLHAIPGKENMQDIVIYSNDKTLLFDVAHPGIIGKSHEAIGYYIDSINEAIRTLWIND